MTAGAAVTVKGTVRAVPKTVAATVWAPVNPGTVKAALNEPTASVIGSAGVVVMALPPSVTATPVRGRKPVPVTVTLAPTAADAELRVIAAALMVKVLVVVVFPVAPSFAVYSTAPAPPPGYRVEGIVYDPLMAPEALAIKLVITTLFCVKKTALLGNQPLPAMDRVVPTVPDVGAMLKVGWVTVKVELAVSAPASVANTVLAP